MKWPFILLVLKGRLRNCSVFQQIMQLTTSFWFSFDVFTVEHTGRKRLFFKMKRSVNFINILYFQRYASWVFHETRHTPTWGTSVHWLWSWQSGELDTRCSKVCICINFVGVMLLFAILLSTWKLEYNWYTNQLICHSVAQN